MKKAISKAVIILAVATLLAAACQSAKTTVQGEKSDHYIPLGCTTQDPVSHPGASVSHPGAADCTNKDLTGVTFPAKANLKLKGAIFTLANLAGRNLSGADLKFARFDGATLTGAHLEGADLTDSAAVLVTRKTAEDKDVSVGSTWTNAHLEGAKLNHSYLPQGAFNGAHLKDAHLVGTRVPGGTFEGATLDKVDMTGANLTGANLNTNFATVKCYFTTWTDGTVRSGDGCTKSEPMVMSFVNKSGRPDDSIFLGITYKNTCILKPNKKLTDYEPVPGQPNTYAVSVDPPAPAGVVWISYGEPVGLGGDGCEKPRPDPNTSQVRFANTEFSYPGDADFTNVDAYSIPIEVATINADRTVADSRGFSAGTDCILADFQKSFDRYKKDYPNSTNNINSAIMYKAGAPHTIDNFLRVISPAKTAIPTFPTQPWPDMKPYVDSIKGHEITIVGSFGNAEFPNQTGYYSYKGSMAQDGLLTLNGTIAAIDRAGTNARPGKTFTAQDSFDKIFNDTNHIEQGLAPGVYNQAGAYAVTDTDGTTVNRPVQAPAGTPKPSENDVYGSIYRDLISGFTSGYWGGKFPNSYNNTSFLNQPPFGEARPTPEGFPNLGYSLYSEVLRHWTPSYSMPYGENYGSGGFPNPLLSLTKPEFRTTILPDVTPGFPESCPSHHYKPPPTHK